MNAYSLGALAIVWTSLTRTTATIAGFHVPAVWLLVAAVVLALTAMVLLLTRALRRDRRLMVAHTCNL